MADTSRFWDRLANRYAAQPIADEDAYRHKLEVTRSHFTPESRVLEFGCGTGSTALLHAPFVQHIYAIDFSARMIEICTKKAEDAGVENVSFEQADITTLNAANETYDVLMGMSILHLLKNVDEVIARVHALLRPGGVFISSTACMGDYMGFIKYLAPLGQAMGLFPELNVMTRADLVEKLVRAGFRIETEWQPGDARTKAVFIVARKPV